MVDGSAPTSRAARRAERRTALERQAEHRSSLLLALEGVVGPDSIRWVRAGYWGTALTNNAALFARYSPIGEVVTWILPLDTVTDWHLRYAHDARPSVVLAHLPIRMPAWRHVRGSRRRPASVETYDEQQTETVIEFARRRDPGLVLLVSMLRVRGISEGELVQERPPGTREDRTRGSRSVLYRRVRVLRTRRFGRPRRSRGAESG